MKLPEESIEEFKEIWKKEYGDELVGFFRLLIEIDRKKAKQYGGTGLCKT